MKYEKYENIGTLSTYNLNNAIDYFITTYNPCQFFDFLLRCELKHPVFKELICHYHGCYFFFKVMEKTFFSHKKMALTKLT